MALIAHYRLDGNANDSVGGNHGTPYNISWVSGKIGQGADTVSTSATINIPPAAFPSNNEVSIAFWNYGRTRINSSIVESRLNTTRVINVHFWSNSNIYWDCGGAGGYDRINKAYSAAEYDGWHHWVVTKNAYTGIMRIYLDGELWHSGTGKHIPIDVSTIGAIGSYYAGGGSHDGIIDDFRFYDHELSAKEVKELSKGLVLHYKFDEFQEPTENLVPNPTFEDGDGGFSSSLISETGGINGSRCFAFVTPTGANGPTGSQFTVEPSTVYTVSAYIRTTGAIHTRLNVVFVDDVDTWLFDSWHVYSGTMDTGGQWVRYDGQLTTGANIVGMRIRPVVDGARTESIYIDNIQVEKKPYATPFVDGTRSGIVRDASGQGNDATLALTTTPRWVEDSKIGSGSYVFGSTTGVITLDNGVDLTGTTHATMTFWYQGTGTETWRTIICRNGGTDHYVLISAGGNIGFYHGGGGNFYSSSYIPDTNMHHYAIIAESGGSWTLYVDGQFIETIATGMFAFDNTNPIGIIGNNSSVTMTQNINGTLDDVRVYATALSADDIKELYQQRASLDDGGSFHVQELKQTDVYNSIYSLWDLNGDVVDSINSNNGTASNITYVTGRSQSLAANFNGIDSNISIPANSIPSGDEISISVWVYNDGILQNSSLIRARSSGLIALGIHLYWGDGTIYFDCGLTDTYDRIFKVALSNEYTGWQYWTFTKNCGTGMMKIYHNGELWHQGSGKTRPMPAVDTVMIGSNVDGLSNFHKGHVEDFRIYNRELAPEEVKMIYEQKWL